MLAAPNLPHKEENIMSIERFSVGKRMSEMVVHGGVAYLAGQVAEDPSKDPADQTRQVLAAIDKLLAAAGTDKTRILRAQIFLADIADFAAMNSVWDAWVPAGHTPARATVEAKLAAPEYKVEIVVTAAV
ncbi:RidA family protein [Pigmentiphaga daeguensis]